MNKHTMMMSAYQIPGMLWPAEQAWLADQFRHSKRHAEIGVYGGRSLFCSCWGMPGGADVLVVDNFCLSEIGKDWIKSVCNATISAIESRQNITITLVESSSIEAAKNYKGPLLDSVWIDADHHYAECKADIEAWSHWVKPGGIICGHDYWHVHVGVMDAVNETGPFEVIPNTRIWMRRK